MRHVISLLLSAFVAGNCSQSSPSAVKADQDEDLGQGMLAELNLRKAKCVETSSTSTPNTSIVVPPTFTVAKTWEDLATSLLRRSVNVIQMNEAKTALEELASQAKIDETSVTVTLIGGWERSSPSADVDIADEF